MSESEEPRQDMFNWRLAMMSDRNLAAPTKHVLLTLSTHMTAWGESCYPTIDQLVYESSLSRRAVLKHLKLARESGWIHVETHGFRGQRWRNNEYIPAQPATASVVPWKVFQRREREARQADDLQDIST